MNYSCLKSRYNGIQSKMKKIGESGCLFLSLCTIIEEVTNKEADIIGIIQESMAKGWLTESYTVKDSLALLNAYTGKRWSRIEVKELPIVINDNDFTIEKWVNPKTGGNHFRRRFVDTYTDSNTVRTGKLECYYIYTYK